ncbi:hypothetical protein [Metabacillus halosaccharovorans]|uniref:DUF4083 domain-containing protein n=1 Tax=Metabacillus halosaccharovorans TaxID=930124 RepID=A0ABT3DLV7_9BACI|nr:hypothetical protein [Metabacillus halosaccharovorans]MCV9888026.1 hypothetical protein [Metabacillus halosaccharovorans]
MMILFGILIFAGIFAVFDAIRKVNNNILDQTEEIKKLREVIESNKK